MAVFKIIVPVSTYKKCYENQPGLPAHDEQGKLYQDTIPYEETITLHLANSDRLFIVAIKKT